MRTIPWAQLLCGVSTARSILRWTASKPTSNELFYHNEPGFPNSAAVHSWAGRTPGKESVGTRRGYALLASRWLRGGFML